MLQLTRPDYSANTTSQVTRLLEAAKRGEAQAAEDLLPVVYGELRRLAAAKMADEKPGHTLQPTALVHEAWLRLAGEDHDWRNRKHSFSAAAEAMRRILVERAPETAFAARRSNGPGESRRH